MILVFRCKHKRVAGQYSHLFPSFILNKHNINNCLSHGPHAQLVAAGKRDMKSVLQVVRDDGVNFDAVNVAAALHKLGSVKSSGGETERLRQAAWVVTHPTFHMLLQLAGG